MRHEGFWEGEQKPSEDCFEKTITAEWFWKVRWPGKGCCTGYSMPDSHQRKQAQTWRTSEQESDCGLVSKAVLHFGDHVLESCGGRVLAASQAFQSNPLPEIHAFEEWRLSFSRTEDIKSISVFLDWICRKDCNLSNRIGIFFHIVSIDLLPWLVILVSIQFLQPPFAGCYSEFAKGCHPSTLWDSSNGSS